LACELVVLSVTTVSEDPLHVYRSSDHRLGRGHLYVELIGLRATLPPLLAANAKTSNNQIPAVEVLLTLWYGLALRAERFEHFTRYRRDPLLPRLLSLPRFPSPDTVRRFFQGFTYQRTTEVSDALMRLSLHAMRPIYSGTPLDLDSTG
jgi:hypothetical protein